MPRVWTSRGTISDQRADAIRDQIRNYDRARAVFDPKRYKRGGSYTATEQREIERMAGGRDATNEEKSALEVHDFISGKPERYFLYINVGKNVATTFMGDVLGTAAIRRSWGTEPLSYAPKGSARIPVEIHGINGVTYRGTYYASAGDYARVKAVKARTRRK